MNITLLKQNAQILVEVTTSYQSLLNQKKETTDKKELKLLDEKIKSIKNQIIYLLTAIKKFSQNA